MTETSRLRKKERNARLEEESLRAAGRLIESTGRCGPWEKEPRGMKDATRCLRCGEVDFPMETFDLPDGEG